MCEKVFQVGKPEDSFKGPGTIKHSVGKSAAIPRPLKVSPKLEEAEGGMSEWATMRGTLLSKAVVRTAEPSIML